MIFKFNASKKIVKVSRLAHQKSLKLYFWGQKCVSIITLPRPHRKLIFTAIVRKHLDIRRMESCGVGHCTVTCIRWPIGQGYVRCIYLQGGALSEVRQPSCNFQFIFLFYLFRDNKQLQNKYSQIKYYKS